MPSTVVSSNPLSANRSVAASQIASRTTCCLRACNVDAMSTVCWKPRLERCDAGIFMTLWPRYHVLHFGAISAFTADNGTQCRYNSSSKGEAIPCRRPRWGQGPHTAPDEFRWIAASVLILLQPDLRRMERSRRLRSLRVAAPHRATRVPIEPRTVRERSLRNARDFSVQRGGPGGPPHLPLLQHLAQVGFFFLFGPRAFLEELAAGLRVAFAEE